MNRASDPDYLGLERCALCGGKAHFAPSQHVASNKTRHRAGCADCENTTPFQFTKWAAMREWNMQQRALASEYD